MSAPRPQNVTSGRGGNNATTNGAADEYFQTGNKSASSAGGMYPSTNNASNSQPKAKGPVGAASTPVPIPLSGTTKYNPVPVPQVSPYYPGRSPFSNGGFSSRAKTHGVTTYASSSSPPPLRQSFRKFWENIKAEERAAVGDFERYSEIDGVCRNCFTPGTTPLDAPRPHHYGMRWHHKKGWRVTRKKSRRVMFSWLWSKSTSSGSSDSSSSSSSSNSDLNLSENTRKKRSLERKIRKEKRALKRESRSKRESREGYTFISRGKTTGSTHGIESTSDGKWRSFTGNRSRGSFSGDSDDQRRGGHRRTVQGRDSNALRGGDLKENHLLYNPGYSSDGVAHPSYYPESAGASLSRIQDSKRATSSSIIGSLFSSRKDVSESQETKTTRPNLQFSETPDSPTLDRYSSSLSSVGSSSKDAGFFSYFFSRKGGSSRRHRRQRKQEHRRSGGSSASSSSSLRAYGRKGSSSRDSLSLRSNKSYVGSIADSVRSAGSQISNAFGTRKPQRRRSWTDYGTPASGQRPGSAAIGVGYDSDGSRYSRREKRRDPYAVEGNEITTGLFGLGGGESSVFVQGESGRNKISTGSKEVVTGRSSSVDGWESDDSEQSYRHSRYSSKKSKVTSTSGSGFLGIFGGGSKRRPSRSRSRGPRGSNRSDVWVRRDGNVVKEGSKQSIATGQYETKVREQFPSLCEAISVEMGL